MKPLPNPNLWLSTSLVFLGLGAVAVVVFWIRRCRSSTVPKHEYAALNTDSGNEKLRPDKQIRSGVFMACHHYLARTDRYEVKNELANIGYRPDKHWFTIQDVNLGAERLLSLVPIPSPCPLNPTSCTRETLLDLFRGLQHPYIHPILDIEFWEIGAALISPLNHTGSLKDLIYGCPWEGDYDKKYGCRGEGLPLRTVQCLGRQILEGLTFLRNRHFPSFYHLHAGNVIIQNGVARLAGLENTLLNLPPKYSTVPETTAFGYLLFEMCTGYKLTKPPTPAHVQLELERSPKVAEMLTQIFQNAKLPTYEELICSDLFRYVELRELRGASIVQMTTPPHVLELLEVVRNPVPPSPRRSTQKPSSRATAIFKNNKRTVVIKYMSYKCKTKRNNCKKYLYLRQSWN